MKPLFSEKGVRLYEGEAAEVLKERKANSIDCVVTSPPYFQMKDYGDARQIGQENSVELYAAALVETFQQVRRVLTPQGTCWINLGDKYQDGALIPAAWTVAFALRADGWLLVNDYIWHKTNATPYGSAKRATRDHEYLFLFAKTPDFYFDKKAVMVPAKWERWGKQTIKKGYRGIKPIDMSTLEQRRKDGKPVRTVWQMPTKPYPGAHEAPYPPDLAARCMMLGSPDGALVLDPFIGSGATAAAAQKTGRRVVGIDLRPDFLEDSLERYRSGE